MRVPGQHDTLDYLFCRLPDPCGCEPRLSIFPLSPILNTMRNTWPQPITNLKRLVHTKRVWDAFANL